MFENINTLRDLNAARVQAASVPDADLVAINNDYNTARQRIVTERKPYTQGTLITVKARECALHRSIPLAGHCPYPGTIELTAKGFTY